MALPTDPESRKEIAEQLVRLLRLPPEKARKILADETARRAAFKDKTPA